MHKYCVTLNNRFKPKTQITGKTSLIDGFSCAMVMAGISPPDTIIADGHIHRFGALGKPGWYVLHLDGIPAGAFGNWKTSHSETWSAKPSNDMTVSERQAMRDRMDLVQRQRMVEQRQRHCEAASKALTIWNECKPTKTHDYLLRKGIASHGVRTDGHHLFIPLRDTDGVLHSLQTISPDGTKRFLPGGRVIGCYHGIGLPSDWLIVCEGFATGASINEATGHAVAIAFNAGNLSAVASALHKAYPDKLIVVAADDDWRNPNNPGLTKAKSAALAVGGLVVVPHFPPGRSDKATDFNDLAAVAGLGAIRACFAEIEVISW